MSHINITSGKEVPDWINVENIKGMKGSKKMYLVATKFHNLAGESWRENPWAKGNEEENDKYRADLVERYSFNEDNFGTKKDWTSTSRRDVRRVFSPSTSWYRFIKSNLVFSSHGDNGMVFITKKAVEQWFRENWQDIVMHVKVFAGLSHATFSRKKIITHNNQWDSYTDSMRIVGALNPHTHSTASENARRNAFALRTAGWRALWDDYGAEWEDKANGAKQTQLQWQNVNKITSKVTKLKEIIREVNAEFKRHDEMPTITARHFVLDGMLRFTHGSLESLLNKKSDSGGYYGGWTELGEEAEQCRKDLDYIESLNSKMIYIYGLIDDLGITLGDVQQAQGWLGEDGKKGHNDKVVKASYIPSFSEIAVLSEEASTLYNLWKARVTVMRENHKRLVKEALEGLE